MRNNICITSCFLLCVSRCIINKQRISHRTRTKHEKTQDDQQADERTQEPNIFLSCHHIKLKLYYNTRPIAAKASLVAPTFL